jgi:anti-anti-sigma factor
MNTTYATPNKPGIFTLTEQDGVLVLRLCGEMGSLAWQSRNEAEIFESIRAHPEPRVVVDLSGLSYGGSELMAFLFRLRRKLRAMGGRVALVGAKGNVRIVLRVVQLDRVLGLYASVADAIASFE